MPVLAAHAVHALDRHQALFDVFGRAVNLDQHRLMALHPRYQVLRRVARFELAVADDDDAVRDALHFRQDVRAQDDRVLAAELLDQLAHFRDLLRVQASRRLVEDQHIRVVNQRLRQAHALAVTL